MIDQGFVYRYTNPWIDHICAIVTDIIDLRHYFVTINWTAIDDKY